jgi:hypothetical protein
MKNYIKGRGILVGTFTELDLKNGRDKEAVEKKKKETGLSYTNTEFVRKNGNIVSIRIYVCTVDDIRI